MPTTCIRVELIADPPTTGLQLLLDSLEAAYDVIATVLDEQATTAQRIPESPVGNRPAHIRQVKRVTLDTTVAELVDTLLDILGDAVGIDWFSIRTHDCTDDLTTGVGTGACPADTVATDTDGTAAQSGSVPEGI